MASTIMERPEAASSFDDVVVSTPYAPGEGFPLFVQPKDPALRDDRAAFGAWFRDNKERFDEMLAQAGAIVFRGFPLTDTASFGDLIGHYGSPRFGYAGGSSPRRNLQGRVFESTYTPPDQVIMLHQEMAYLPNWPSRIAFFCRIPSVTGGETFIADMRRVTRTLDPALVGEVEKRGVRYRRNFREASLSTGDSWLDAVHRSWQTAFDTDDRGAAMAACEAMGLKAEWLDDGSLDTVYRAPGIIAHPRTGEKLWFNHFATKTICVESIGQMRYDNYERHYGSDKARPYNTTFGDGTKISGEQINELYRVLRLCRIGFAWSQGDLMLLDNYITAHGRNEYSGLRDVQVALLV
jgi:alpha-ketoglutarate-dependent taurine dioxygenase